MRENPMKPLTPREFRIVAWNTYALLAVMFFVPMLFFLGDQDFRSPPSIGVSQSCVVDCNQCILFVFRCRLDNGAAISRLDQAT